MREKLEFEIIMLPLNGCASAVTRKAEVRGEQLRFQEVQRLWFPGSCPAGHGNNAAASPVGIVYGRNYDGI